VATAVRVDDVALRLGYPLTLATERSGQPSGVRRSQHDGET
jgi:hypothetical protein